jgi:dTDP-4-dehydrorhamnose 3,5-epimerase
MAAVSLSDTLLTSTVAMGNKVMATTLPEVKLIEPDVFCDEFGFCFESFSADEFADDISQGFSFVQDRHLRAVRGVLRGLHYQVQRPQGRLVRVVRGEVFDVAVDVRLNSPNFGKWTGAYLSETNQRQIWVPPGFAYGFVVLSDVAECLWKTTEYWFPELERCILWCDPDIGIEWPIDFDPILGTKDAAGRRLYEAENIA